MYKKITPSILEQLKKIVGNEFVFTDAETIFNDTFPVAINEINSGIVYIVEWSFFRKMNRHSYIIKGFNEDHEDDDS